jgi:hypothetical protein
MQCPTTLRFLRALSGTQKAKLPLPIDVPKINFGNILKAVAARPP